MAGSGAVEHGTLPRHPIGYPKSEKIGLQCQDYLNIQFVYNKIIGDSMTSSKKTDCYEDLRSRVLTLALAPGSALDETALSREFGVSRTPFREVLQRLAGEGYVVLERNRGAVVASMDLEVMRRFFQTAPMVYAATSRLAAENAMPSAVAVLKDIQSQFRAASTDADAAEMVLLNHQFHERIGTMADNPYLTPSLGRLLIDHTRMSQTFYRPRTDAEASRVAAAGEQHDRLIEAIERRDPATAVAITLEHWELSRHEIELYVRPDPLPVDLAEPEWKQRNAV